MGKAKDKALKPPKTKCCVSSSRCGRCPLRMLKEGTLPDGYAVKRRRLVSVAPDGRVTPVPKKAKIAMPSVKDAKKAKKAGKKKKYAAAA